MREPTGAIIPKIAPSSVYPSKSGEWLVIGGNGDAVFKRFAAALNHPEWLFEGHRFSTHASRGEHQEALDAEITGWTLTQESDAILEAMNVAGVPSSRIYTAADIVGDPHYRARDMVLEVESPTLGGEPLAMVGVVPKLSETPGVVRRGGPTLGEHNSQVWGELLGLPRVDALHALGVI